MALIEISCISLNCAMSNNDVFMLYRRATKGDLMVSAFYSVCLSLTMVSDTSHNHLMKFY